MIHNIMSIMSNNKAKRSELISKEKKKKYSKIKSVEPRQQISAVGISLIKLFVAMRDRSLWLCGGVSVADDMEPSLVFVASTVHIFL